MEIQLTEESKFIKFGNPNGPVLVCIPGLLGGPEDFSGILPEVQDRFNILIINPIVIARDAGLNRLSPEILNEVSYDSTAVDIYNALINEYYHEQGFFFLGISLGGKVVYDFAIKYPKYFRGGLITDVGLASFESSPLYTFVEGTINKVDLNLNWLDMKSHLRSNIPDKNLRILIQTQISYPTGAPPAIWKVGMKNFKSLLQRHEIDEQGQEYKKIDEHFNKEQKFIHVLKAEKFSGISDDSYQSMKCLKSIKFHELQNSSHFLHITHKDKIREMLMNFNREG